MADLRRRQILSGMAAGAAGAFTGAREAQAFTAPKSLWNVSPPPAYTPNLVIGSGFGGAVGALRLAQAGQSVTVVERGFRWSTGPRLNTFGNDTIPDGRCFWFRTSAKMIDGTPAKFSSFGGMVDASVLPNMTAWMK